MEIISSNTIHLDLANFFLFVNKERLNKEFTSVDVRPTGRQQEKQLKKLKSCLRLIRRGYNEDGGQRIGIKKFYISTVNWNTLKGVMLFLHHQDEDVNVLIKYKNVELFFDSAIKDNEVGG